VCDVVGLMASIGLLRMVPAPVHDDAGGVRCDACCAVHTYDADRLIVCAARL
jgi:hypothetical protein